MKKLNIAFNCADSWIKYTAVSIASILENRNKNVFYAFHILTNYVSDKNRAVLESYISHYKNTSVDFIIIDNFEEKISKNMTINPECIYYRLYIPDIFRDEERVLFLDSDTIVDVDISELLYMDFEDKVAIVSRDIYVQRVLDEGGSHKIKKEYFTERLKMSPENYFNAGFVLFNNKILIELRGGAEVFNFLLNVYEEIKPVFMNDQDVLNSAFARLGGVKIISEKYNYTKSVRIKRIDILKKSY